MNKPRPYFVLGGLVIALGAIAWLSMATPKPTEAERIAPDSVSRRQLDLAAALCKNAALQVLKSPSSVQFHDEDTDKEDLGKGRSEIQFQVDAGNSLGAMIRTTVDCKTGTVKGQAVVTSINSRQR
jgi:hypothetical protein